MNQILEQLGTYGIVPVVVLQDAKKKQSRLPKLSARADLPAPR